jgi:hypothetical protein
MRCVLVAYNELLRPDLDLDAKATAAAFLLTEVGAKACESDRVAEKRRREGNGSFILCSYVAEEKGKRYGKPIE